MTTSVRIVPYGMPEHKDSPHSHETTTPLYRSGRTKVPLTLNSLKKWVPDGTCGHELSRPKHVSWLPAYGMVWATSIPVACQHTNTCQLHVIIIYRWAPWRSPLGARSLPPKM